MRTIDMEYLLMLFFDASQNTIVPTLRKYSLGLYFETDLLVLSKNRYATGVEIKVSKTDLKKDFSKPQHESYQGEKFKRYYGKFKHFYYAVPKNLKDDALEIIPDFCGLLVVESDRVYIEKKPPLLFKNKWTKEKESDLRRLGCIRILKYKRKLSKFN